MNDDIRAILNAFPASTVTFCINGGKWSAGTVLPGAVHKVVVADSPEEAVARLRVELLKKAKFALDEAQIHFDRLARA